jgi:hypothetical protein
MSEILTAQAEEIVETIKPLLAGRDPAVQGSVIADLLSIFIAGHHPAIREEALAGVIELTRNLIPVTEAAIFSEQPKPEGWEKQ